MRPQWFALPSESSGPTTDVEPPIPFNQMWDTDPHWIPLLLSKTPFVGRVDSKQEGERFSSHKWWFGVSSES